MTSRSQSISAIRSALFYILLLVPLSVRAQEVGIFASQQGSSNPDFNDPIGGGIELSAPLAASIDIRVSFFQHHDNRIYPGAVGGFMTGYSLPDDIESRTVTRLWGLSFVFSPLNISSVRAGFGLTAMRGLVTIRKRGLQTHLSVPTFAPDLFGYGYFVEGAWRKAFWEHISLSLRIGRQFLSPSGQVTDMENTVGDGLQMWNVAAGMQYTM